MAGTTRANQNYIGRCTKSSAITKSDTVVNRWDAIFVGSTGNLVVKLRDDSAFVTFNNIPDGTLLPFSTEYVGASSTCSNMVGLIIDG